MLVVRHGPKNPLPHLVTNWVLLVPGLLVVLTVCWPSNSVVFLVFTMVTRVSGYVNVMLPPTRPESSVMQDLFTVPWAMTETPGIAVR